MNTPILYIRDPELIKLICIKDFDHFPEHYSFGSDSDIDPLWDRNLFGAKGTYVVPTVLERNFSYFKILVSKWKKLRPLLSPTFTSSKMKLMFTLIDESSLRFVQYFKNQDKAVLEVELKDALSRFTNDVIATTAFGIECDSLKNRSNEFYLMGKNIIGALSGLRALLFFTLTSFPTFMKVLPILQYILSCLLNL